MDLMFLDESLKAFISCCDIIGANVFYGIDNYSQETVINVSYKSHCVERRYPFEQTISLDVKEYTYFLMNEVYKIIQDILIL